MTNSTGIEYTHRARQAIVPLDSVQALLINTANHRQTWVIVAPVSKVPGLTAKESRYSKTTAMR
jgi:hypothetical protein